MEQIQPKGSRDGNAIFAQMPGQRAGMAPFGARDVDAFRPDASNRHQAGTGPGLIPAGISRKSGRLQRSEKDPM
ncbi:hypothetical protein XH79_23495 [Bradyrhizobium sp. CCBAU 45389]|nr:hypothetical protein [Bradyrhizobium sp. CCBAU 45389]